MSDSDVQNVDRLRVDIIPIPFMIDTPTPPETERNDEDTINEESSIFQRENQLEVNPEFLNEDVSDSSFSRAVLPSDRITFMNMSEVTEHSSSELWQDILANVNTSTGRRENESSGPDENDSFDRSSHDSSASPAYSSVSEVVPDGFAPNRTNDDGGKTGNENAAVLNKGSHSILFRPRKQLDKGSAVPLQLPSKTRLGIIIRKWNVAASWKWLAGDETCGICRMPFEACCIECKTPGDECPLALGCCKHAFHMHCIVKWTDTQNTQKPQCPLCRQEWKFASG